MPGLAQDRLNGRGRAKDDMLRNLDYWSIRLDFAFFVSFRRVAYLLLVVFHTRRDPSL